MPQRPYRRGAWPEANLRTYLLVTTLTLSNCATPEQKLGMLADESLTKSHIACEMIRVGELPVREQDGHLYIDATIQQQPVSLIFDTGSGVTTLTRDAAERLKLQRIDDEPGRVTGIGGSQAVGEYDVHFRLNGIDADWQRNVFAGKNGPDGTKTFGDGLIGTSFFPRQDFDLDLPEDKIILYFPQHDCSSPTAFLDSPLTAVPLVHPDRTELATESAVTEHMAAFYGVLLDRSPNIEVAVTGKSLIATVDSGSPDTVLFLSGAKKIGLSWDQLKSAPHGLGYGFGPNPVPEAKTMIPAFNVGNLEIHNVPVTIIDENMPDSTDMLLGLDFIKRVHLWISYSSDSLIMEYPPTPSPPFQPAAPTQPPT